MDAGLIRMRVLIVGAGFLVACSSAGSASTPAPAAPTAAVTIAPTPTPAPSPTPAAMTGDLFAAALAKSGILSADVVVYTDATDPNHFLGRPGQYVGKVNWTDSRAPAQKQQATVEIFADDASMQARFSYLSDAFKAFPTTLQYMYRNDARRMVLRVPRELTPSQAAEYESWLKSL
jgi:hypothetical protein